MSCTGLSQHDGLMPQHRSITPAVDSSQAWIAALRGPATPAREDALETLHSLLLRATRFVMSRRRDQLAGLGRGEVDDLAVQAADDALMSILSALDDFHGASSFTTWACKFAVHEAGAMVRRELRGRQDTAVSAPRLPSMHRSNSA
jgi:RNA polymerase sigma-70 factor (ECF subfamily)